MEIQSGVTALSLGAQRRIGVDDIQVPTTSCLVTLVMCCAVHADQDKALGLMLMGESLQGILNRAISQVAERHGRRQLGAPQWDSYQAPGAAIWARLFVAAPPVSGERWTSMYVSRRVQKLEAASRRALKAFERNLLVGWHSESDGLRAALSKQGFKPPVIRLAFTTP